MVANAIPACPRPQVQPAAPPISQVRTPDCFIPRHSLFPKSPALRVDGFEHHPQAHKFKRISYQSGTIRCVRGISAGIASAYPRRVGRASSAPGECRYGLRRISQRSRNFTGSHEVSVLQRVSVYPERSCGTAGNARTFINRTPLILRSPGRVQSWRNPSRAPYRFPSAAGEKRAHSGPRFAKKRVPGSICRFPNRSHTIPLNAPCTIARGCADIAAAGTARCGICLQPCFDQEGQTLVPASGSGRRAAPRRALDANPVFRTMAV